MEEGSNPQTTIDHVQEVQTDQDQLKLDIASHSDDEEIEIAPEKILEALQKDQILMPHVIQETKSNSGNKKRKIECEICNENPSKYCCPGCAIRTCSLGCVNQHKKETECTGKRARTYYSMNEMNDQTIREDYTFLKEVERLAGESYRLSSIQSKKDKKAKMIGKDKGSKKKKENEDEEKVVQTPLPPALKKLVGEANSRGVILKLMPRGMTRRKINTSFYAYRSKKFFWRIEWIFKEHVKENQVIFTSERVDDSTILRDPLEKILNSIKATTNSGDSEFAISQRKQFRESCKEYLETPIEDFHILISSMNTPSNRPYYDKLDLNLSLHQNFEGKTIIEFPTLLIVHPLHINLYSIC